MAISKQSDLETLSEGTRLLVRRPWATLALAVLGAGLLALPPLIQLRTGLGEDPAIVIALTFAALIPLELYFIPRFLMEADAGCKGDPRNPAGGWEALFEARFLRAFGAKALLSLVSGIGLALFVLPGLLVLLAFGWAPLRVLLRGESLAQALRGSVEMMSRSWRRMVLATSAMALVCITFDLLLGMALQAVVPDPSAHVRLVHPAIWAGNLLATLASIWLSACLLALFQRLETPPAAA